MAWPSPLASHCLLTCGAIQTELCYRLTITLALYAACPLFEFRPTKSEVIVWFFRVLRAGPGLQPPIMPWPYTVNCDYLEPNIHNVRRAYSTGHLRRLYTFTVNSWQSKRISKNIREWWQHEHFFDVKGSVHRKYIRFKKGPQGRHANKGADRPNCRLQIICLPNSFILEF